MPHPCKEAERKPIRRTIAEYLKDNPGLSKRTVWNLAERGELRLVKFGGRGKIFVEETEKTVRPVLPGEHSKSVQAMLAARRARAEANCADDE